MNKKIIGIIALAIAIVGVGVLLVSNKKDEPKATDTSQTAKPDAAGTKELKENVNGNLFTLTESGKSTKCTYSFAGAQGTSNGTIYSDGKGRGLMMMSLKTEQGNDGETNILVLEDKVYSWVKSNGGTIGFMYDKDVFTKQTPQSPPSGSTQPSNDANQKFDLDCENWSVDEALLTVPADINFTTLPTGIPQ